MVLNLLLCRWASWHWRCRRSGLRDPAWCRQW